MNSDWQTWAAAGVVLITLGLFVRRAFWPKKKRGGSCGTCGSAATPTMKRP